MSTRTFTFEERLYGALHAARDMRARHQPDQRGGARELALVVTKLEEAVLWNDAGRAAKGLPPLGLDWKP